MTYTLPFPPTVNHIWKHGPRGVYMTKEGKAYRVRVFEAVRTGRPVKTITGRVKAIITVFPPDNRRRDLDNLLKATLDALTYAQVWLDDSQIDSLTIERGTVERGNGRVVVNVEAV